MLPEMPTTFLSHQYFVFPMWISHFSSLFIGSHWTHDTKAENDFIRVFFSCHLTNAFISFDRLHILFISSQRSSISLSFAHMPLKPYCVQITRPSRSYAVLVLLVDVWFCDICERNLYFDIHANSHLASVWSIARWFYYQ